MSAVWVKICGITRRQDAEWALTCGADALGMVFYPASRRAMSPARATLVFRDLPVQTYALFVDPSADEVDEALQTGCFTGLQFQGLESDEFCKSFSLPYTKAIRVGGETDPARLMAQYPGADKILLDTYDPGMPGGTGKTFDWDLAGNSGVCKASRLVIAGGLDPDNVIRAISHVRPFGVDVASGVESTPGIKDAGKVKRFIEAAKSVRS